MNIAPSQEDWWVQIQSTVAVWNALRFNEALRIQKSPIIAAKERGNDGYHIQPADLIFFSHSHIC